MILTAPIHRTSVTARQLNLTLLLSLVVIFAMQISRLHLPSGLALLLVGFLLLRSGLPRMAEWNRIPLAAYPTISTALIVLDGFSFQESGLSYFYPALYLHLLISRDFDRKATALLGFGVLCLALQLWQPFVADQAIIELPQRFVFAVTLVGLTSAFLMSITYLNSLRAEREELLNHNTGLTAHLEQFNRANILLMTTDQRGAVSYMNDTARKVFFPANCSEITLPADFLTCIEKTLHSGLPSELEFDRSEDSCRLHFQKGITTGTVNISGEIMSGRKESSSKHVLEAVSERISAGLLIVDKSLGAVYANAAARALLFSDDHQQELAGSAWLTALTHKDSDRLRNQVLPSIKQKGAWAGVVELRLASGQRLKRLLHIYRTNNGMLYCLIADHATLALAPGLVDELVLKEIADEHRSSGPDIEPLFEATTDEAPAKPKDQQVTTTSNDDLPRILVADDDEINREIAGFMLKRCGIQVDFAQNGKEAVDQHRQHPYDIIILDLNMPIMSGLEAADQLSAREGDRPILVATTANPLTGIDEKLAQVGFTEFLPKPFKPETIADILKGWEMRREKRRA